MKKLRWIWCSLALALASCVAASPDGAESTERQADVSSPISAGAQVVTWPRAAGPASTASETCTTTESACKVGQCELGPHDTFSTLTEVCCTPSGSCTTERYRLCGC